MYEVTCPHCKKDNHCWENDACPYGSFFPVGCEHCQKEFYIERRSWFDPTYDNLDVNVKTEEELIAMGAKKQPQ